MSKKKNEVTTTEVVEVIDAAPKDYDYLNSPLFSDIKKMINETIRTAVDKCDPADTNTVSVKFDMDRDVLTEDQIVKKTGRTVKVFEPIEANISLVSKKKIINEKIKTDTFTSSDDQYGGTKIEKLQPSLFD
jgi:hypothetical protein